MNKQQLAAKIWEQANAMRSKIEANEYKDYILGFIFYKYLSENQLKYLKSVNMTDVDIKLLKEDGGAEQETIQEQLGYFIAYEDLFSTWIEKGRDFEIANVRDALSAFNRLIIPKYKRLFDGIFNTLETGLSKLGESAAAQTKSASELIHLINDIPMNGKQDYDVLGFIYEYLIGMFAANAGKKAGEFYTPHEVSILMAELIADHLKDRKEIRIYDPTSGSGSLLINIGKAVTKHMKDKNKIMYYAQELKQNTYNLTRMNLIMRGIIPDNIKTRNADTLEDDWPYFDDTDGYALLTVDAVVSNPPYSQQWDPTRKHSDPRYAPFGLAPKTKADYAFLLHDLYHIKPDGIMTIVLPHGVLFRGTDGGEGSIRKNLIEQNHIDTIIGLPANIFFGTGIPTIIIVLKKERTNTDILIVDASKGFVKEGKSNKLRSSDIKKIVDTVIGRIETPKYSKLVDLETLRQNDYNLNIPRYVDSFEEAESWDIYASMFGGIPKSELEQLNAYWEAFPQLKETLFTDSDTPYVQLKTEELKAMITQHESVVDFIEKFDKAFDSFVPLLSAELVKKCTTLSIAPKEVQLSDDIFTRVQPLPLINKYEVYQYFSDCWEKITIDLEIIQTEGFKATKQVNPNMVVKKDNKEVQEGWIGHILPFELIQQHTSLYTVTDKLYDKQNRLSDILSELEGLLDELSEEDKEQDFVKDGTNFVSKAVTEKIKELDKDTDKESQSLLTLLKAVDSLLKEEKELKKTIKIETDKLHLLTKSTIENLSDDEVSLLLEHKWITPLVTKINALPEIIITNLVSKIQHLVEKYATTFEQVEQEIQKTELSLSELVNELEGEEFDMLGLQEFKSLLSGEK